MLAPDSGNAPPVARGLLLNGLMRHPVNGQRPHRPISTALFWVGLSLSLTACPNRTVVKADPLRAPASEERAQEAVELLMTVPGLDAISPDLSCRTHKIDEPGPVPSPEPLGTFHDACSIPGMSDLAQKNCELTLEKGIVPRKAFLFAMKGLKRNATRFETKGCFDKKSGFENVFGHYSTPGLSNKADLESALDSGIPNKCSLIINDYDDLLRTHGGSYRCQAAMYYIDLCGTLPKVQKSYSWVGYGTCKNKRGFKNQSGQGTSLLGFSVTATQSFNFQKSDAAYTRIRRELGGKVPAVALFGLQNSNNGSAIDYKYLHVGAYTSAGCPSIDKKNAWMIEALAEKGPSVVVGYKDGQMEEFEKCESSSEEDSR